MQTTITLNIGSNVGRTSEVLAHDTAANGVWASLENHKRPLASLGAKVTRYQHVNVYNYDRETDYEDEYTTVIRVTLSSAGVPDQASLDLVAHTLAVIVSSAEADALGQESVAWATDNESGRVKEGLAWGPNVEPAYEFNNDYFLNWTEAQKTS